MGCFILGILGIIVIYMFSVSTSAGVITLVLMFLIFFALMMWASKNEAEENKKRSEKEKEVNQEIKDKMEELGFTISQRFDDVLHPNKYKLLALDENTKKVVLVESGNYRSFGYQDILESEIIIDGKEVTRTSRSSQVGRALVGGLVAGGVGAIIGGVGAKQEHKSEVKRVQLKVVVNDIKEPSFILDLLKLEPFKEHATKEDAIYINAMKHVTKIHDIISVLIRQADEVDRYDNIENTLPVPRPYTADELERLYALMEKGILTKEEYQNLKTKLLNQ